MPWGTQPSSPPQNSPQSIDSLLLEWKAAKEKLDDAKAVEASLRTQCVDLLKSGEKQEGTEYHDLGNGWRAKMVHKLNFKFDDTEKVEAALDKIEATGNEGKFIAERLVKFDPRLSLSEYRGLDPQYRGIIDEVVTITPGLPTLELVPPKGK